MRIRSRRFNRSGSFSTRLASLLRSGIGWSQRQHNQLPKCVHCLMNLAAHAALVAVIACAWAEFIYYRRAGPSSTLHRMFLRLTSGKAHNEVLRLLLISFGKAYANTSSLSYEPLQAYYAPYIFCFLGKPLLQGFLCLLYVSLLDVCRCRRERCTQNTKIVRITNDWHNIWNPINWRYKITKGSNNCRLRPSRCI